MTGNLGEIYIGFRGQPQVENITTGGNSTVLKCCLKVLRRSSSR